MPSADPEFLLERRFAASFVAGVAMREKQVQQSARPVISLHKWFARRPGSVFRSLIISEFDTAPLQESYWQEHTLGKVIADPFLGGGTTAYEALRLGCSVAGSDINPMSAWLVKQAIAHIDIDDFKKTGVRVWEQACAALGDYYRTECQGCKADANVKYFLWAKECACPACDQPVVLQPSLRIAQDSRHTHEVYLCPTCDSIEEVPSNEHPRCSRCDADLRIPTTSRATATCPHCQHTFPYADELGSPPKHKMVCIEYHCSACYPKTKGRQFKAPDHEDRRKVIAAERRLAKVRRSLPIPDDQIPAGDETDRLIRWGYGRYSELFNDRQLLSLGVLGNLIREVEDTRIRQALATVFSDSLRYQNLLCRYDSYALKCQDIFAVHGFPVGLSACENNVAGIPKVGSGSFIHFVEKYARAKEYTQSPTEIRYEDGKKRVIPTPTHPIEAPLVVKPDFAIDRSAWIASLPSQSLGLKRSSLDAVFTDPPYFGNVQYSELMDFCYVWLRRLLEGEVPEFAKASTRHTSEATGNVTQGRGLEEFASAISDVFRSMALALKPGAPLAFTYHHNDITAYAPLVVAMLDAGFTSTDVLPAPAEMAASIHINNTKSSILDSIFVCRDAATVGANVSPTIAGLGVAELVQRDLSAMTASGYLPTTGDEACIRAGHVAGATVRHLSLTWDPNAPTDERLAIATSAIEDIDQQDRKECA